MKKFLALFLVSFVLITANTSAVDNLCPKGKVNDPYPGDCGLYVDENKNGICDLSESTDVKTTASPSVSNTNSEHDDLITGQELKTKTIGEVAVIYGIDAHALRDEIEKEYNLQELHCSTSFSDLHDKNGVTPSKVKEIAKRIASQPTGTYVSSEEEKVSVQSPIIQTTERPFNITDHYYPIILSVIVLLSYATTSLLVRYGKLSLGTSRRIWNIVLLFSFLISGILGLVLALIIEFKASIPWYKTFLWLHVEFGIVMAIVAIFHALWHSRYYLSIIKSNKKSDA